MGAGQSTTSSSQAHPPTRALHVLKVAPFSPASQTSIEAFFDFVVGFEGDKLSTNNALDASTLATIVEAHEDRTLNLIVWNSKNHLSRVIPIVPSRTWAQSHLESNSLSHEQGQQPSLLGLSMRVCEPEGSVENVWHVLDVLEGSPAESAGLVPMGDWIVGWSGGPLSAENDFYDLVEAHVDKPLRVYIYSHDFDTLREVVLIPNRHWGGEGLLGCIFGFGLLHRIPSQSEDRAPGSLPAEFQEEYEDQELFVPADIQSDEHSLEPLDERKRQEQEQWSYEMSQYAKTNDHAQGDIDVARHTNDRHYEGDHSLSHSHDGHAMRFPPSVTRTTLATSPLSHMMNGLDPEQTSAYSIRRDNHQGLPVSNRVPHDHKDSTSDVNDPREEMGATETDTTSRGSLTSVE